MSAAHHEGSAETGTVRYPLHLDAFRGWNEVTDHTQALVGRDLPKEFFFGNEFWAGLEVEIPVHTAPVEPLPSPEEFIGRIEGMRRAVLRVQTIADRVFGGSLEDVPSLQVEFDPVLGGLYLVVEVPVSGLDREKYRQLRRSFDTDLAGEIPDEHLERMVVYCHLDASAV